VETLLVAAVAIVVGLALAGFGARLFPVLLPLWGFLAGLVLGADLVASTAGVALFSTLGGWLAGTGLGIALAGVAGLSFTGAVLVLGVGLGTAVGSGLLAVVGIDGGVATLVVGVAAGAAVGVAIILADLPSVVVAAVTAYGGAMWLTTGLLLLLGRVSVGDLHGGGPAGAIRGDVPAIAIAFALGTLAFAYQARDLRARRIVTLPRPGYRF
jgi:predicted aconitase with swiveling domain